jgi:hypothetical protein
LIEEHEFVEFEADREGIGIDAYSGCNGFFSIEN